MDGFPLRKRQIKVNTLWHFRAINSTRNSVPELPTPLIPNEPIHVEYDCSYVFHFFCTNIIHKYDRSWLFAEHPRR